VEPRYSHAVGRLGMGLGVCAVVSASAAAIAYAAPSPLALRSSIVAAIRAQHSLHYISTGRDVDRRWKVIGDIGRVRGVQQLTIRERGAGVERETVVVVPGTAYLRGNRAALHDHYNYSAAQSSRYANRWISIPRGQFAFREVAGDVTLPFFLADYMPRGRLSVVRGDVDGRKAVGLHTDTGLFKFTVYVRSVVRPLPIAVTSVQYEGASSKGQFNLGPWNRHLRVRARSHAVPVAKVLNS